MDNEWSNDREQSEKSPVVMSSLKKVKRRHYVGNNVSGQESNRECEEFQKNEEMLELRVAVELLDWLGA